MCVDGSKSLGSCGNGDETFPQEGSIYSVRGFDGGVLLEELANPPQEYSQGLKEISFRPERFRPLVSKSVEAGMNMLRKLGERKKQQVLVE